MHPKPLDTPVATSFSINNYTQPLLYKREGFLCKNCGRLGDTKPNCSYPLKFSQQTSIGIEKPAQSTNATEQTTLVMDNSYEWQTVHFTKNKKPKQTSNQSSMKETPIVKFKTFDIVFGKFLNASTPMAAPLNSHPQFSETSQYGPTQGQTSKSNSLSKPTLREIAKNLTAGLPKEKPIKTRILSTRKTLGLEF